jgi:hypothetical protein
MQKKKLSPKRKATSKRRAGLWYFQGPKWEGWGFKVIKDGHTYVRAGYTTKRYAMLAAREWFGYRKVI